MQKMDKRTKEIGGVIEGKRKEGSRKKKEKVKIK